MLLVILNLVFVTSIICLESEHGHFARAPRQLRRDLLPSLSTHEDSENEKMRILGFRNDTMTSDYDHYAAYGHLGQVSLLPGLPVVPFSFRLVGFVHSCVLSEFTSDTTFHANLTIGLFDERVLRSESYWTWFGKAFDATIPARCGSSRTFTSLSSPVLSPGKYLMAIRVCGSSPLSFPGGSETMTRRSGTMTKGCGALPSPYGVHPEPLHTTRPSALYFVLERVSCDGVDASNKSVCGGTGRCVAKDSCICPVGYAKPFCTPICTDCTGHCVRPGLCICAPGHSGPNCTCGCKHGKCVGGKCVCESGYMGSKCEIVIDAHAKGVATTVMLGLLGGVAYCVSALAIAALVAVLVGKREVRRRREKERKYDLEEDVDDGVRVELLEGLMLESSGNARK